MSIVPGHSTEVQSPNHLGAKTKKPLGTMLVGYREKLRVVEFTKKQCNILMHSLWESALLQRKEEWILQIRQLP